MDCMDYTYPTRRTLSSGVSIQTQDAGGRWSHVSIQGPMGEWIYNGVMLDSELPTEVAFMLDRAQMYSKEKGVK